jgi:hypothetical protein
MDASEQLIYSLVDEFSECRPLLTEHLVDMEGELLPYLLLGDVVRWACQQSPSDPDRVSALVRWLEHRFEQGTVRSKTSSASASSRCSRTRPSATPSLRSSAQR